MDISPIMTASSSVYSEKSSAEKANLSVLGQRLLDTRIPEIFGYSPN